jgi:hypothetical protein
MLGLASRRYGSALPAMIAEYGGDVLWAVALFVALGALLRDWPPARVALAAVAVAYLVEVSQLYHAPWIDAIRGTRLGGLTLGYGFLWSDIVCYTGGVLLCLTIEQRLAASPRRMDEPSV